MVPGEDWFGMDHVLRMTLSSDDLVASTWTPAVDIEEKDGNICPESRDCRALEKERHSVWRLKDGYLTAARENVTIET